MASGQSPSFLRRGDGDVEKICVPLLCFRLSGHCLAAKDRKVVRQDWDEKVENSARVHLLKIYWEGKEGQVAKTP